MAEDILEAEVFEVPPTPEIPYEIIFEGKSDPARSKIELNITLGATIALCVAFLIFAMTFGEMLTSDSESQSSYEWWETPLDQRHTMELPMDTMRAQLPENGTYDILPYTEHFVSVDLPASEQDAGFPEEAKMHVAIWLPDVPEGTKVPVIMTIHPYYDFGGEGMPGVGADSNPNTIPDGGVGKWVYDTFVPHGYALAQASTFGTGQSTHCQDVKGLGEQTGIQAVVDWLGVQNWSNGNVGLMGKSYAGTTNWEAAQQPSEHLKTIVPISGSIGVQEMFYRNGSSEARAMGYDAAYQAATTDLTTDDLRVCSDDLAGPLNPWTTYAWAEFGGGDWSDYWDERRHLPDVLENYRGSVYLVWGLQDWNVDPYHAFPTYQLMRDAGINARAIAGQWAHNYPDQPDRHSELGTGYGGEAYPNMSRMDWAVELFGWFQYYLKDIGDEPEPMVQIQTNDGQWHVEETWPPEDMTWLMQEIGTEWSGDGVVNGLGGSVTLTSPPYEDALHMSGLPTLHLDVTTQACNGGQIFATMYDDTNDLRLGHATMDIRYRDGGFEAKPAAPFSGYTMLMEFNPMDVIVPAGHSIRIELTETGEDYLPGPCAANPLGGLSVDGGMIGLPLIDRPVNDDSWFLAPAWWEQQPIPA